MTMNTLLPHRRNFLSRGLAAVAAVVSLPLLASSRRVAWAGIQDDGRVVGPDAVAPTADLSSVASTPVRDFDIVPMSCLKSVLPGRSFSIRSIIRQRLDAFRPYRILIGGTPSDWRVHDVLIGGRSQLSGIAYGEDGAWTMHEDPKSKFGFDIGGERFSSTAADPVCAFETALAGMSVIMYVTYAGTNPDGAPFVCSILGRSVDADESRA